MFRFIAGLALATGSAGALALALAPTTAAQTQSATPAAASCEKLAALALPDTAITSATIVAGPSFAPPTGRAMTNLPAFCRVAATSKPAVRFEVWLPLANWNGKFQGVG
ncbi:MAG: tannase/feruloyl esterase family alpha/beta hydrolase, partial [Vicinamibacterales bacterium]